MSETQDQAFERRLAEGYERQVVTEGRAYHPGDTVILRSRVPLTPDLYAALGENLKATSKKTGVYFVMLGPDIEVVEPEEA